MSFAVDQQVGDAQDVHPSGLDLRHEQDVQAPEEHGVNVQEVTRQDGGRPAAAGPESSAASAVNMASGIANGSSGGTAQYAATRVLLPSVRMG